MLVYAAIIAILLFAFMWLRQAVGQPYRSERWEKRWARLLNDDDDDPDAE